MLILTGYEDNFAQLVLPSSRKFFLQRISVLIVFIFLSKPVVFLLKMVMKLLPTYFSVALYF